MGFSRQEYWSGLPCPSPGDLPNPGIKRVSLALTDDCFTTSATWAPPGGSEGKESACSAGDLGLWRAVPWDEQSPANSRSYRTLRWLRIYTGKGGQGVRKGQKENLDTGRMERGRRAGRDKGYSLFHPRPTASHPGVTALVKSRLLIRQSWWSPMWPGSRREVALGSMGGGMIGVSNRIYKVSTCLKRVLPAASVCLI